MGLPGEPSLLQMDICRSLYFSDGRPHANNNRTMKGPSSGASCPPPAQGLYDPRADHDACGVGFVVHMKGVRSHDIVEQALQVLVNLEHRGACGCESNTGDGAGILLQMPDAFLRQEAEKLHLALPPAGEYGVG